MKKTVLISILTTIACGLLAFSASTYKDFLGVTAKVVIHSDKIKTIEKKVDEVHWFLIRRKGVVIPGKK